MPEATGYLHIITMLPSRLPGEACAKRTTGFIVIWIALLVTNVMSEIRTVRDVIGVTSDEYYIADRILRHLAPEGEFTLEAIRTDTGELEFDKVKEIESQIRTSSYYGVVGKYDRLIAMVTEKLHVPYLCDWMQGDRKYLYGILPHPAEVWSAFRDLVERFRWDNIGLLFEDIRGAADMKRLLDDSGLDIRIWKISADDMGDVRLREMLKRMRDTGISNFIFLTRTQLLRRLFLQARRLGLISKSYSYLVPNLLSTDISSGILDDIEVNVTSLNMVHSFEPPKIDGLTDELRDVRYAALYDAIHLLVDSRTRLDNTLTTPSSGNEIVTKINQSTYDGLTGSIQFNEMRQRVSYTLSVMSYSYTRFIKIGDWRIVDDENRLDIFDNGNQMNYSMRISLAGRTGLRVVTILERPFTELKDDHRNYEGNAKYKGFAVDLISRVASDLNFDFEMYPVPDGKFGSKEANGEWNGMIGQVLSGNATMSMAPLSINADRENAIDFTKPFKTRGITVVMKTPKSQPSYFQFLRPLSTWVWLCIGLGIVTISIVLYCIERANRVPGTRGLNVPESCWFVFGGLVQGGTDISPASTAGRMLSAIWWLFALLMVSSYTANLAAFLTVKKIQPPIATTTDLAGQTKIKFGTVMNSGVEGFFKNTRIPAFAEMWTLMDEIFPDSMVNTTEQGLARVKEGNYAFLWDSTVTSYVAAVDCDFTEIGPPVDPKGFGIGVPPGATFREELSLAILKLQDNGFISELENKYWGTSLCPDFNKPNTGETTELQLENVAGIFFILVGGVALAILTCLIFTLATKKKTKERSQKDGYTLPGHNGTNL